MIKGEDWTNHYISVHNPGVLLEPLRESEVAGPECIIRSLAAKEDWLKSKLGSFSVRGKVILFKSRGELSLLVQYTTL